MRNLSSTFRHEMYYNSHDYDHKAIITLANDTVLTLTNTELWAGGFSTDDAVSEDNSFTALGSTIIGSAKIIINNIDQAYSDYDFTNAKVELSLSKTYMLNDVSTTESIRIGRYTVDECVYNGGTITLSVLDNMEQFDRPYSLSNLTYPATLVQIVQDACVRCGVLLQTYTFPHYNYSIPNRPVDEAITFRQVLGWVATIAGCFARCNSDGKLELKWFDTSLLASINEGLDGGVFDSATPYASGDTADGGSFNPWNTGYDYDEGEFSNRNNLHYLSRLYSQTIGVDDIVITGIHIVVEEADENNNLKNKEYTFGESGYIIKVEGNKLINKDSVSQIGTWLANAIVGMRFRNVNITHIDDPSIEAGDIALVIDRKQNEYPILITRTSYSAGGSQTTVCGAESPSRNSASRFSQVTQAYVDARNLLNKEQTRREQAVQALVQALEAKSGLYSTEESASGGGTIYYLHDKPLLADSKVVWKMTSEAIGVTTDYDGDDTVWNFGVTVNGDVIARILTAIGINADWINTGSLKVEEPLNPDHSAPWAAFELNSDNGKIYLLAKDKNGNIIFKLDSTKAEVELNCKTFKLQGSTINSLINSAISGYDPASDLDQETIFNILTNGGEEQGIYLAQDGKLYLNWDYAKGGTLKLGGDAYDTWGTLEVWNEDELRDAVMDSSGLQYFTLRGTGVPGSVTWVEAYATVFDEDGMGLESLIDDPTANQEQYGKGYCGVYFNGRSRTGNGMGGITICSVPDRYNTHIPNKNNIIHICSPQIYFQYAYPDANWNGQAFMSMYLDSNNNPVTTVYGQFSNLSDINLKKNIKCSDVQYQNILNSLNIVSFDWKEEKHIKGHVSAGLIAQDVEKVFPELVLSNNDTKEKSINFIGIIPIIVGAYQEQQKIIDNQQKKIENLEERLTKLESLLSI